MRSYPISVLGVCLPRFSLKDISTSEEGDDEVSGHLPKQQESRNWSYLLPGGPDTIVSVCESVSHPPNN